MIVFHLGCFEFSLCERCRDGIPSGSPSKNGVVVRTMALNLHNIFSSSIGSGIR